MRVSIIMTTYNRPDYLSKTIDGYLHQTRLPDEIIIGDDGSTEETEKTLKKIQEKTKVPIIHIWQEDQGFRVSKIRNKAIAASTSDYLIHCDDDTIPGPQLIEDHLKYAKKGCFIQGHRVLLGSKISTNFTYSNIRYGTLILQSLNGEVRNLINAFRPSLPLIRINQTLKGIRTCNMSFFRSDLVAVNGFNEDFVGWGKEDSELVTRLYRYGLYRKDIKFRACCYHLYHPPFSRDNLNQNIQLLEQTQSTTGYYCEKGVDQYLTNPEFKTKTIP